jgi:hypothetical protein
MRGKIQADKNEETDDVVRLKPKLGLRPGVYLTLIYGFVILLVLYFILLHSGITKPGAVVVFTSEPWGAALRVDGVYRGSSPCKVFVPKGRRVIEVVLPGFTTDRVEADIPGRVFASLLFPRRHPMYVKLEAAQPLEPLEIAAYDFAAWSFGPEPTAVWQAPMVLSEGVYRAGGASVYMEGILKAAARFAVTRAGLRDLVRAKNLSAHDGNAASPLSLIRSVSDIVTFLDSNPNTAMWLADTLPVESSGVLISSSWYGNQLSGRAGIIDREETEISYPPFPQIRVAGLMFTGIIGKNLEQMEPFPHIVPIEPFMICATPVPSPAFADFLDANPQWGPDQKEALESRGLVTGEYLAGFEMGVGRTITSISAVSWYAARAFCEWLETKLPDSLSGWEVRLPTEAEWEHAVKSTEKTFVRGSAWEWCWNPYSHLPFISAPPEAVAAVGSPEYPLRGGSLLNSVTPGNPETRASLPPESCSSFVSFRPVIARKGR